MLKFCLLECGIGVSERIRFEESGCCHQDVENIFEEMLQGSFLQMILSQFDQNKVNDWIKKITNSVGVECMSNAKDNFQIREELIKMISNNIL